MRNDRQVTETNLQLFFFRAEMCQLVYVAAKNVANNSFLMRIPKWGLPFLHLLHLKSNCEKAEKYFCEVSDY
jgi:hypothetical protein